MRESESDLQCLQAVLDASYESAGPHLRSIITPERRLTAVDLTARLTGMKILALATVNSRGAPIAGPVDGIFYRGEFWFGTSPEALRVRHIRQNPAVSATHVPGEDLAVTVHGTAHIEGAPADLSGGFREVCRGFTGTSGWSGGKARYIAGLSRRACLRFCWRQRGELVDEDGV